ncbi:Glucose-6-phosphate 1-epimerase [Hondaea fermentalgiana]|uniref:glucose-6-phosphate 1-epimerase n=1 Tax=Hondaea fermentalgiana TaxID=2315210 RepID=A0A2R5G5X7_9STRA|nr:Glucose-6-phosphate 1-epimerase [Hondaea fermentalgiana]|eukprot:GBG25739.1 Glucose-6-phosphate 1-epimerase [Hondaea fermentalgiana]
MVTQKDVLLEGKHGGSLEALEVTSDECGASIRVTKFGGTLYSYKDADGEEKLFASEEGHTDRSKPVRGGVPLVFPQFGGGELPKHGFARTSEWLLEDTPTEQDGIVTVAFVLESNEETLKIWPFKFKLVHNIVFGASKLQTSMHVVNVGEEAFKFQALLHTYYLIEDISQVQVVGLKGLSYVDQLRESNTFTEENDPITFEAETDRIYTDAKGPIEILDGKSKKISIELSLSTGEDGTDIKPCDAVLWNPWTEKSKGMGDFGDEEFHTMMCLEPGCVSRYETCEPNATWVLTQRVTFSKM